MRIMLADPSMQPITCETAPNCTSSLFVNTGLWWAQSMDCAGFLGGMLVLVFSRSDLRGEPRAKRNSGNPFPFFRSADFQVNRFLSALIFFVSCTLAIFAIIARWPSFSFQFFKKHFFLVLHSDGAIGFLNPTRRRGPNLRFKIYVLAPNITPRIWSWGVKLKTNSGCVFFRRGSRTEAGWLGVAGNRLAGVPLCKKSIFWCLVILPFFFTPKTKAHRRTRPTKGGFRGRGRPFAAALGCSPLGRRPPAVPHHRKWRRLSADAALMAPGRFG